jgi:predicted N-acyltransferase
MASGATTGEATADSQRDDNRDRAAAWAVEELSSLDALPARSLLALDRVAKDPFHTAAWFRMLAKLDVSSCVRGRVRTSFLVARRGESILAFCPLLDVEERSIYHWYNPEKAYFTQALDEIRVNGDSVLLRTIQGTMRGLNAVLNFCGTVLWRALIVVSPLSYRSDILVLTDDAAAAESARRQLVRHLKRRADSEGRPLLFLGVDDDNRELADCLGQEGLQRLFYLFDGRLELTGQNFEEFLKALPRASVRERYRREIRAASRCGLNVGIETNFSAVADELSSLYAATYRRYGGDFLHHGPEFFRAVETLGPSMASLSVAKEGGKILSFALLIRHGRDLYNLRVGTDYQASAGRPAFFNASFYEPVRYGLREGCTRMSLGLGAFEIKHRRGGTQSPLHLFVYLPGRLGRSVVLPYMRAFAEGSRRVQVGMAAGKAAQITTDGVSDR